MKDDTKFKITSGISALAIIISIVALVFTYDTNQKSLSIQESSLKMQQDIYEANTPFRKAIVDVGITEFNTNITRGVETEAGLKNEGKCTNWHFDIKVVFKNYGQGIAQNVSYSIVMSDIRAKNWTEVIGTYNTVNEIYPNTNSQIELNASYSNCNVVPGVIYIDTIEDKIAFIVNCRYYDKVSGEMENQTYWFKYVISEDEIFDINSDERDIIIKNYRQKNGEDFYDLFF